MKPLRFQVTPAEAGLRLDRLLTQRAEGLGRRHAAALFAAGQVWQGQQRARKSTLAEAGAWVVAQLPPSADAIADPSVPLAVVLETPRLLIVDKPAGQPTAPLRAEERGTLVNALLAHAPALAAVGYSRRDPGVVHRLDTQTSGLVLVAKDQEAFAVLLRALRAGELDKRYLAVVPSAAALAAEGVIDVALAPSGSPRRVHCAARGAPRAHRAETHYRVVERGPRWTLVEATARHAYRHQVRAHLASLGAPLAGDELYGGARCPELGERHALHASQLAWSGTATLPGFVVRSAPPAAFGALLARDD